MTHDRIEALIREGCKRAKCKVNYCSIDDDEQSVQFVAENEAGKTAVFKEWFNEATEIMLARRVYRGCQHYLNELPYYSAQPFGSL